MLNNKFLNSYVLINFKISPIEEIKSRLIKACKFQSGLETIKSTTLAYISFSI